VIDEQGSPAAGAPGPLAPAWRSLAERGSRPVVGEGLRDRKKRELRQRISDEATRMFLERGFDAVRVSEIADACDVSEKTVYNYFPTKESLIFDREEDQSRAIEEALADRGDGASIVDSLVAAIVDDVRGLYDHLVESGQPAEELRRIRRFADLVEETPALAAALQGMADRMTQVAAAALAQRAGVDPDDPEPQMAAMMVMGLWRTQFQAMRRYADGVLDIADARDAVIDEIRRAASVAASGLSSFNAVVRSAATKDQLREAAESADQARKQVVAAMKQARAAWRQVVAEVQAHQALHQDVSGAPGDRRTAQRTARMAQMELRAQIRQHQQELRQQAAERRREQARMREVAAARRARRAR
jgi:AcrR family transcriptional regulator